MKPVFILLLLMLMALLLSVNNNNIFYRENFSNNSDSSQSVCFDPCPSRNTIHKEILFLKENIDAIQIRMDKYDSVISGIEKDNEIDRQDQAQQQAVLKQSQATAQRETVENLAGPTAEMTGISKEEVIQGLEDHFSEEFTEHSVENIINNMEPISEEDMLEHNKKMADLYDNQDESELDKSDQDAKKTANNYINSNRARCICPENVKKQDPNIENRIINEANSFGFEKRWHGLRYCSATSDCALKYAKEKLKELCSESGCQTFNPDGQYPYNLKEINQNSNGNRPKDYNFPQ